MKTTFVEYQLPRRSHLANIRRTDGSNFKQHPWYLSERRRNCKYGR